MSNFVSGQQSPDEEGEAETQDWSLSGISHLSGGQSGIQGRHFLPSEVSNLSGRSSNLVSPDLSAMIENDSGNEMFLFEQHCLEQGFIVPVSKVQDALKDMEEMDKLLTAMQSLVNANNGQPVMGGLDADVSAAPFHQLEAEPDSTLEGATSSDLLQTPRQSLGGSGIVHL